MNYWFYFLYFWLIQCSIMEWDSNSCNSLFKLKATGCWKEMIFNESRMPKRPLWIRLKVPTSEEGIPCLNSQNLLNLLEYCQNVSTGKLARRDRVQHMTVQQDIKKNRMSFKTRREYSK